MELRMILPAVEGTYSLELTSTEAEILKAIIGRISGEGTGRKFVDELYDALDDVEANTETSFSGRLIEK